MMASDIIVQPLRMLINAPQRAGRYIVTWDGLDENGRSVGSDIYFYQVSAGDFRSMKKMLMLK